MPVGYETYLAHAKFRQQKHILHQSEMQLPSKRVSRLQVLNNDFIGEASQDMAYFEVGKNVNYEDTHVALVLELLKRRVEQINMMIEKHAIPEDVLKGYFREERS